MSKASEFLAYLSDAPQTREQLQEASGDDAKTVSNRLSALKTAGSVKRTKEGWVKVTKANGSHAPSHDESGATPPQDQKEEEARNARRRQTRGGSRVQLLP